MKIGIITHYYHSFNYGGNLQAYALCKYLNQQYDAEQICYINKNAKPKSRKQEIREFGIFKFIKKVINWGIRKGATFFRKAKDKRISGDLAKRKEAILSFNHSIPHSQECYDAVTIQQCEQIYDVFITGSDQVWHPDAVNIAYLLNFVHDKRKISYAASLAVSELSETYQKIIQDSLKDYHAISVREKTGAKLLQPLFNFPVQLVVDPVFLLEKGDWEKIASDRIIEKPYLL